MPDTERERATQETSVSADTTDTTDTGADRGGLRADFHDVIGGSDALTAIGAADTEEKSLDEVAAAHPDLAPIRGGDVSDTPAARPGTRGEGTGADTGTGAEVGVTRPSG
jgi:hypothetical protein